MLEEQIPKQKDREEKPKQGLPVLHAEEVERISDITADTGGKVSTVTEPENTVRPQDPENWIPHPNYEGLKEEGRINWLS